MHFGGGHLKAIIKYIIKELYSLDLQQLINFTGREKKFQLKNLKQTKIILGEKFIIPSKYLLLLIIISNPYIFCLRCNAKGKWKDLRGSSR